MAAVVVRNLPASTHEALKARAARHGRSTEAEIRQILEDAVRQPLGLGSTLAAMGREVGGVELELSRRKSKISPASFE